MIPTGYMLKNVVLRPAWIEAETVVDIYSLSNCISHNLPDYINFWKHNGYWMFDSPNVIADITDTAHIDVSGLTLFYYELYEHEYDDDSQKWSDIFPEPGFPTAVVEPPAKVLHGYDVATYTYRNTAECSPLSCNMLASELPVNKHCLFNTFDEAKGALEAGKFRDSEPGPYRILAVYTVGNLPHSP